MALSAEDLKPLRKISVFLRTIGFTVLEDSISASFLSGVEPRCNMTLAYDPDTMVCAGDVLHEAGHLAIIPSVFRNKIAGNIDESLAPVANAYFATHAFHIGPNFYEDPIGRAILQADESAAQAWSYAAALAAGIDPKIVFDSESIDDEYAGVLTGLHLKCHAGINSMTASGMTNRNIFPKMHRWLQL